VLAVNPKNATVLNITLHAGGDLGYGDEAEARIQNGAKGRPLQLLRTSTVSAGLFQSK